MSDVADQWESACTRALPRLGAYAYALTGSRAAAEELVQAAIVKVLASRLRFPGEAAVESRLSDAVLALHLEGPRGQARWVVPTSARDDAATDGLEEPTDPVAIAMAALPPQQRTALAMRYLDGRSASAISQRLHLSEGAAQRCLDDGRARLAALLGADDVGPEPELVEVREARR